MQYYSIVAPRELRGEGGPDQKPPRPTHPPIEGWESFLQDGEGYLKTALAAHEKRNRVFTPEILFNVAAMAIENSSWPPSCVAANCP